MIRLAARCSYRTGHGLNGFISAPRVDAPLRQTEMGMSQNAQDLMELQRLAQGGAGALTETLLREYALRIIAAGLRDERGGL